MAFFWLSRVRTIWVTFSNHLIGESEERRVSLAKKTKSIRGSNCTVLQWPLHLVYSHDRKKKYNPKTTIAAVCWLFWSEAELAADMMEWTMLRGVDFPLLIAGSLIPQVLSCLESRMYNPLLAWELVGFRGSERPAKRWVAKIAPHARETYSSPIRSTRRLEYWE